MKVLIDESAYSPLFGAMHPLPPDTLELPTGSARVAWRRNARARRISLRIDPCEGAVVVTLPARAGHRAGMALLMEHVDWVADRLAALPDAIRLVDGAMIPICDVPHRITHVPNARGGAWIQDGELHVTGRPEFLARRVKDFLRSEARRQIGTLAAEKTQMVGLRHTRLTVKDTRSRWGSCASDGSLAFSWRLIMAPPFVQDYVAAHEVAHLRHMDHGKRFWGLVDSLTPHTAAAIPWLRTQGSRLLRVG